jgi:hypothetical protein
MGSSDERASTRVTKGAIPAYEFSSEPGGDPDTLRVNTPSGAELQHSEAQRPDGTVDHIFRVGREK